MTFRTRRVPSGPAVLASALLAAALHAQSSVTLEGYVTAAGTPSRFLVNERTILCDPAHQTADSHNLATCPQHAVGEHLRVEGTEATNKDAILATSVHLFAPAADATLEGKAVISRILSPFAKGAVTARADGYPLLLNEFSDVNINGSPAKSLDAVTPNTWIHYKGKLTSTGTVQVLTADIYTNRISNTEVHLNQKNEFDPSIVTEDDRQGATSKFFTGLNSKRIPAWHDEAMQARISELGARLVPDYQRKLEAAEPTRINFRFHLVDQPKVNDCLALPSGIILVPYQVVQKLQDDNELATVLAAAIAGVLDKQALHILKASRVMTAASVAGLAAYAVPGASIAATAGNSVGGWIVDRHELEQRSRESLDLLHDAGFDITKAPTAWWRLEAKGSAALTQTKMPFRTQYTYRMIELAHRSDASAPPSTAAKP